MGKVKERGKKRRKIDLTSMVVKREKKSAPAQQTPVVPEGNVTYIRGGEIDKMIENALNNGCLLWFDCGKWGNRKQLANDLLERAMESVGVSQAIVKKRVVRASQDLLDRNEVDAIKVWIDRAQRWARMHSLPWMTKSIHFIHKDKIEEGDQFIKRCKENMLDELEDFLNNKYDDLRAKFASENPKLYDPKFYPSKDLMRSLFRLRHGFVPVARPSGDGKISVLSVDRLAEEDRKFRERMKEVIEESIVMVRTSFAEMVGHLETILQPEKKFQERAINKVQNYLEEFFSTLNVYNDTMLADVAGKLLKKMKGVGAEEIRTDEQLRASLRATVGVVKAQFEKLPQIKLERDIDIDF